MHALDVALRSAISETYPHLGDIRLVNYKVRILDEQKATGAVTRVLLDASDGTDTWGAIGVSENVIEAELGRAGRLARGGHAARPRAAQARHGGRGTGPMSTQLDVIPLAKPVIGEAEEQAVLEVLRSGHLSLGPRVPAFEDAFAARVGARHASAVSSGTAGLHLALRAVGVAAGDEVVTTPFSFVATANAALYEGARPVFADIDPVTLNLDPDAAAAAITERTAALLPVHIFGYPADLPAFERHGLPIVEDAGRGARGALRATAPRSAGAATRRSSRSTPTSRSPPARAG